MLHEWTALGHCHTKTCLITSYWQQTEQILAGYMKNFEIILIYRLVMV